MKLIILAMFENLHISVQYLYTALDICVMSVITSLTYKGVLLGQT